MEYKFLITNFDDILKQRVDYFSKNLYKKEKISNPLLWLLKDHFVELFSWSVLPINIVQKIRELTKTYHYTKILDPSAGSGFHACILNKIADLDVAAFDIQPEDSSISWYPVEEKDLRELDFDKYSNHALFLSWLDGNDLAIHCLKNYKGGLVISVGNYEDDPSCREYLNMLDTDYNLVYKNEIETKWKLFEQIKIFVKSIEKAK